MYAITLVRATHCNAGYFSYTIYRYSAASPNAINLFCFSLLWYGEASCKAGYFFKIKQIKSVPTGGNSVINLDAESTERTSIQNIYYTSLCISIIRMTFGQLFDYYLVSDLYTHRVG